MLSLCLYNLYAEYMKQKLGWMTLTVESRLLGEISITSGMQWYHPNGRKWRRTKEPIDEGDRGEWKSWLKTQHSKNEHHGIRSHQFSHSVMSDSLQPHELQQARIPCPSPTPEACSNSHPSSQWCHPTISSSVIPFSTCLQSFPASGSFPMSQFFISGGQSIGVSASVSVFPMNI